MMEKPLNFDYRDGDLLQRTVPDDEELRKKSETGIMSMACLFFLRKRLFLLPILTASFILLSFILSYIISVSLGHTEPDFPYISHTANEAPERCIFGQMINIGAVMLGLNVIVRYLFIKEVFWELKREMKWHRCNIAGLILGFLSAVGLSMVANFQSEVQKGPHYTGACFAFVGGMVYAWIQVAITRQVKKGIPGIRLQFLLQVINSVFLTIVLLIFGISKVIYKVKDAKGEGDKNTTLRAVYLVSTISEWLLAFSVLTFILTYIWDFSKIKLQKPAAALNDNIKKQLRSITMVTTSNGVQDPPGPESTVEPVV